MENNCFGQGMIFVLPEKYDKIETEINFASLSVVKDLGRSRPMKSVISIGNQDFISIRKNNCFYIDKTDFIREWWDNQDSVTLITRPRRFGKTLNMSMLKSFFEIERIHRCLMGSIFLRIRNCANSIRDSIRLSFFL